MLPRLFLDADGTVRLLRLRLRLCSWRLITPLLCREQRRFAVASRDQRLVIRRRGLSQSTELKAGTNVAELKRRRTSWYRCAAVPMLETGTRPPDMPAWCCHVGFRHLLCECCGNEPPDDECCHVYSLMPMALYLATATPSALVLLAAYNAAAQTPPRRKRRGNQQATDCWRSFCSRLLCGDARLGTSGRRRWHGWNAWNSGCRVIVRMSVTGNPRAEWHRSAMLRPAL